MPNGLGSLLVPRRESGSVMRVLSSYQIRAALHVGLIIGASVVFTGCATYQYAKNVKLLSFDGDLTMGRGAGPVRGESCQSTVMGYAVNESPTLDKAVANAMQKNHLRYMNNVSTENAGFSAVVYARQCLVVKGTGFQ